MYMKNKERVGGRRGRRDTEGGEKREREEREKERERERERVIVD